MAQDKKRLTVADVAAQVAGQGQAIEGLQGMLGELVGAIKNGQLGAAPTPEQMQAPKRVRAAAPTATAKGWRNAVLADVRAGFVPKGKNEVVQKFGQDTRILTGDDTRGYVFEAYDGDGEDRLVRYATYTRKGDGSYATGKQHTAPESVLRGIVEALAGK